MQLRIQSARGQQWKITPSCWCSLGIFSPASISAYCNGAQNSSQLRTSHIICEHFGQNYQTHDRKSILSLRPLLESTGALEGRAMMPLTLREFLHSKSHQQLTWTLAQTQWSGQKANRGPPKVSLSLGICYWWHYLTQADSSWHKGLSLPQTHHQLAQPQSSARYIKTLRPPPLPRSTMKQQKRLWQWYEVRTIKMST